MELVNHLPTTADGVKVVKMDKGRTPYGVPLYKLCILRKMTQQLFRRISIKGTYPFKCVYFNIIIENDGFNGDICVAHFWCDYTKYHYTFLIKNHEQKTLLPLFESMIIFTKKFDA